MDKPDRIASQLRHARLFELIRQDNILRAANRAAPPREDLERSQIQRFLARADRSFNTDTGKASSSRP
ncbi:hypothetical protein AAFO92_06100 [Roseovarius sp. CAU 1744]|uniref:hypothetical protein n=1 Tax=Roseovarius sp. CAU 1744 TaxID=3140368 RepID=UPI00325B28BF